MVLDLAAPKEFEISSDPSTVAQRWKKWVISFQFYLTATGVTEEEQKRALLLHVAGTEVQEVFSTLSAADGTCAAALNSLNAYFAPKANIRYERYLFCQSSQEQHETIDVFVMRLKKLAATCEFTDIDDVIIDQVIEKTNSHELRKKLLQERGLTLDRVQGIARALEAANLQSNVIEGKPIGGTVASGNANVDKISARNVPNVHKSKNKNVHSKGFSNQQKPQVHNNGKSRYKSTPQGCYRCGKEGHFAHDRDKCPATGKECNNCGYSGHFASVCRKQKGSKNVNLATGSGVGQSNVSDSSVSKGVNSQIQSVHEETDFAFQINSVNINGKGRVMVEILINKRPITMQVDTAADVTVMSESVANTIPKLTVGKSGTVIKDYNNADIKVIGAANVDIQYGSQKVSGLPLIIVKGNGQALLGLDWLKCIKLDWHNILTVTKPDSTISDDDVLIQFKEVFEDKVGTVKNVKAGLVLKPDAVPKFCNPRPVPYALKMQVEMEIKRLESEGAWEKITYSDWATPLVPVMKENGRVRLCGDYKVTVNPQLQVAQHPLPNPKDMFAALGGCKLFSKLDLRQAFNQMMMDKRSREICTVNTSLGLYRPKRLPYGIASSPALWQETMDKIFAGIPGVFVFIDDILVAGKDKQEHQARLKLVLSRIQENGIKVQRNKCVFGVASLEYLGFIINGDGIHKTDEKIRAVQLAKVPESVKELQSFLGLVTFYGGFIQDLATVAHPLYNLLKKNVEWHWSKECQKSFERIKHIITSPTFLVHYQVELPVKLTCDASSVGIGAVLAHVMPDGTERPIAFASRSLNKAEVNYAQIEKEGLALVYGVKKFHMYLYGRKKFTLVTDHKPLLAILGSKASLPALVAARLQRWAIILAAYNYEIEYRPTSKMGNADALSRLPVDKAPLEHDNSILLVNSLGLPITAKDIAQSTRSDTVLSKVLQSLITGRNTFIENDMCKPYKEIWNELSVEQDCILRGSRIVIPTSLRDRVLSEIHADHQGIVRSKSIARTFVWWPGIDKSIELYIKRCQNCALQQNNPKPVRMHPWECPRYAWQRLHIDFAGPFLGHSYLIVVDAYSKWPEVIPMQSTTSICTIKALMQIFATHGLPERIVTDNGPQFCSQEFKEFLKVNGIQHAFSAPYHPATNGEAERFVQTFKHSMKCKQANSANIFSSISKFLLAYRSTVHATTGMSPSTLLMGRRIRTKLDLIYPSYHSQQERKGWEQLKSQENVKQFTPTSQVLVRSYNTSNKWVSGEVKQRLGNMHYEVKVNGNIKKRHVDQLKPSMIDQSIQGNTGNSLLSESEIPYVPETTIMNNVPIVDSNSVSTPNTVVPRVLPERANRGKPPERLNL